MTAVVGDARPARFAEEQEREGVVEAAPISTAEIERARSPAVPVAGPPFDHTEPAGNGRRRRARRRRRRRRARPRHRPRARRRATTGAGSTSSAEIVVTCSRLSARSRPTKSATNGVAGLPEDPAGVSYCSRRAADVEDRDAVAHLHGFVDVVGDEHDRLAAARACSRRNSSCSRARVDRVDRTERLVHEQHRRIRGERAGDADALALPARELRRIPVAVARRARDRRASSSSSTRARRCGRLSQPSSRGHGRDVAAIVWCGNRPTCWIT